MDFTPTLTPFHNGSFNNNNSSNPPSPQQPILPSVSPIFGLIIPGCPVRTDFVPIDPSGYKFALRLTCPGDIITPLPTIRELVFFLLPNQTFPVDQGVLIYWQIANATNPDLTSTGYELLGAVTTDRPSAVLPTGWSEHEQIMDIVTSNTPVIVTIGISIEPIMNVQNALSINNPSANAIEHRLYVAQKIASDLFQFMQSFDTSAAGRQNQLMTVPTNIFDRWFQRFENRFRRDPNFFLKSSD